MRRSRGSKLFLGRITFCSKLLRMFVLMLLLCISCRARTILRMPNVWNYNYIYFWTKHHFLKFKSVFLKEWYSNKNARLTIRGFLVFFQNSKVILKECWYSNEQQKSLVCGSYILNKRYLDNRPNLFLVTRQ